jgi:RNA polymerase-binding transcription factor DksA
MSGPVLDTRDPVSSLDTDALATIRSMLLSARSAQEAAAAEHSATALALSGQADVDSLLERQLADVAAVRAQADVVEIDGALARLDAGTYGQCESCGLPIAPERLEVIPQTRLCVTCSARG